MPGTRRIARQVRKEIDEPGLRASVVADVSAVVSTGTAGSSARQSARVRQGSSARTRPEPEPKEQS